ncbi:MAG: MaoC family dehydratase [Candidatus Methylopumilus sp.]|nr:MaoC family dehydratase [Candidatus Methylopumilus sp.]
MHKSNATNKSPRGNFFEDFKIGQVFQHATPRTVSDGDSALYIALTGARQVLHSAQPVAHAMGYQNRTIDDLLAFHIALGKTVPDISINAIANLGYAQVQFVKPIYAGDTISAKSTVVGLKQNSDGKSGIVYVQCEALNQDHQVVISWIRWVMVRKSNLDTPAPETVIPELSKVVDAKHLNIPSNVEYDGFDTSITGSSFVWDDYEIGEVINHPSGMTVDESDHTLATKLYQNPARLHFDASKSTYGKRLVFGGHVMSVCRALSYEGLENALSIAAINGGAHCNPTFGGDTLYAHSEVLDRWEIPGRTDVGALRLRLIGVKEKPLRFLSDAASTINGKQSYNPNVVLDLDYTVLMPRR